MLFIKKTRNFSSKTRNYVTKNEEFDIKNDDFAGGDGYDCVPHRPRRGEAPGYTCVLNLEMKPFFDRK